MLEKLNKTYISAKNGNGRIPCYPANEEINNIIMLAQLNKQLIEEDLLKYGGVLFRDFTIRSLSEFNQLSAIISPNLLDYINRSTPRTKLGGKIYTATEYPADKFIPFHNENSYTLKWPEKILFFSVIAADEGGETAIADSREVYRLIDPVIIDKFNHKKILYVRNFIPGIDLSWQEVFQTENKKEVEKYCDSHFINYEWKTGKIELTTKQICQATTKHPITNEDVWFNQAHLFNISSLEKEVQEELLLLFGKDKLTRNSYYGDSCDIEIEYIDKIKQAYEKERIEFSWRKGDVMILDNRLMAHSRNPFKGSRKLVVSMGNW